MSAGGRPKGTGRRPQADFVREVITDCAASAGVSFTDVLADRSVASSRARRSSWLRILAETGCSKGGLADVWGCHRQAIHRALKTEQAG